MHEQFHAAKLRTTGYTGPAMDIWKKWLSEQGFTGPIPDAERAWLASKGYTGSLNDQYMALYRAASLTGSLDDMGANWVPQGGGGTPGNDPMWNRVWFFNPMRSLSQAALPVTDNGAAVQSGSLIAVETAGPFGQDNVKFSPVNNTDENSLSYGRNVTTLDPSAGFTVDLWINISSGGIVAQPVILEVENSANSSALLLGAPRVARSLSFLGMGVDIQVTTASNVFMENQWFHLAWVFAGGNASAYVNGTRVYQGTATMTPTQFDRIRIGSRRSPLVPRSIGAHFSDVRITAGIRYTGESFPVPTEPVVPPSP